MDNLKINQLAEALTQSDQTVADLQVETQHKRQIYATISQHLERFLQAKNNQWLVIPGLRGIGKTTLLAQLYNHPSAVDSNIARFYFSLDELSFMNASMRELVEAFKLLRQKHPKRPFLICLDEVHFDPRWSLGCKLIFDQIPDVMLVCTGSSALSLRLNPDSARRALLIKMHPLFLTEYVAMRHLKTNSQIIQPPLKLVDDLRLALLESSSVDEVYKQLTDCQQLINNYLESLQKSLVLPQVDYPFKSRLNQLMEEYVNDYGTMPPSILRQRLDEQQLAIINQQIPVSSKLSPRAAIIGAVEQTVIGDTMKLLASPSDSRVNFQLQAATINRLPELLRALAASDQISLRSLATQLQDIQQPTLRMMLKVLIMSELIIEIPALGSLMAHSNTKTPKYLFGTPAIRQALVSASPNIKLAHTNRLSGQLRGRLLEDVVAMYLGRILDESEDKKQLRYDSKSSGADFIIVSEANRNKQIVIEVGHNKQTANQVSQTLKRSGGLYGLVITPAVDEPRLDIVNNAVYVPLSYFLLI